ncbi:MAG TPA: hypothetical protein VME19_17750 [Streptosporangiaceae bacterium]|nr:hypothetical protein [Streptosporangiaceae bacterium]
MALSRFVLTATVTLSPDTLATVTAGEPGTGGAAGYGNTATVTPGTSGKFELWSPVIPAGTVIVASSLSTDGAAYLLYEAIGSANLRAWVDGQDSYRGGVSN